MALFFLLHFKSLRHLFPGQINDVRHRELKLEKADVEAKLEQALIQSRVNKAKHDQDKVELESRLEQVLLQCKLYKAKYDVDKVEQKSKRKNVLLQCKLYKAQNNLDKGEYKSERKEAEIEVKRQRQNYISKSSDARWLSKLSDEGTISSSSTRNSQPTLNPSSGTRRRQ